MRSFHQSLTLHGRVVAVLPDLARFDLETRAGDVFPVTVGPETAFSVLSNLDGLERDRVADPTSAEDAGSLAWKVRKYAAEGSWLTVIGVYQEHEANRGLAARSVVLPHFKPGRWIFEETHWWISQIALMADKWLDDLFATTRSYEVDDFARAYRTNLGIEGRATDDGLQECATLARLIYGLSSAYLLTGSERYLNAARAGVRYQRDAFRSLSHDAEYCFWAHGRRLGVDGSRLVLASTNGDDRDTIPLYEQIYALAGLAQFYRITQDWEVLEDIRRTVNTFQAFYHDDEAAKALKNFPGLGGWFSHLDHVSMRPDTAHLGANRSRKNWNSIGDHVPAYLINLILALDPLPRGPGNRNLQSFVKLCRDILEESTDLILDKFPDPAGDFVDERFHADWTPERDWGWQQNRAIVGHDLKIAWNLSRVAFYCRDLARRTTDPKEKARVTARAEACVALARRLGEAMAEVGLDRQRGGIFDALERTPRGAFATEFAWMPTKDFWQQEQGILAYLILHGIDPTDDRWLRLARESAMFWNAFFLDRDRRGIFFRTDENGTPVIRGSYAQKGGHSISGYHAFELNYLAHLYIRTFVVELGGDDRQFCLHFDLSERCEQDSVNVLPDFLPTDRLTISRIRVNGVDRADLIPQAPHDFQIPIASLRGGAELRLAVEISVF